MRSEGILDKVAFFPVSCKNATLAPAICFVTFSFIQHTCAPFTFICFIVQLQHVQSVMRVASWV